MVTVKAKLSADERRELLALVNVARNASAEYAKAVYGPHVPGAIVAAGEKDLDAFDALTAWVWERADFDEPCAGGNSGVAA